MIFETTTTQGYPCTPRLVENCGGKQFVGAREERCLYFISRYCAIWCPSRILSLSSSASLRKAQFPPGLTENRGVGGVLLAGRGTELFLCAGRTTTGSKTSSVTPSFSNTQTRVSMSAPGSSRQCVLDWVCVLLCHVELSCVVISYSMTVSVP